MPSKLRFVFVCMAFASSCSDSANLLGSADSIASRAGGAADSLPEPTEVTGTSPMPSSGLDPDATPPTFSPTAMPTTTRAPSSTPAPSSSPLADFSNCEPRPDAVPVRTQAELQAMRPNVAYRLMNDLTLTGSFSPISSASGRYHFDGNGRVIRGLSISGQDYVGIFGKILSSCIFNVVIEGATVSGRSFVGILVGYMQGGGAKLGPHNSVSGQVTASGQMVGGVAGMIEGGGAMIDGARSSANVTSSGTADVGGVVGRVEGGGATVMRSAATGTVSATNATNVGGVVGLVVGGTANVTDSYARGNVLGRSVVGGVAGQIQGGGAFMRNVYSSTASVSATGDPRADSLLGVLVGGSSYAASSYYDRLRSHSSTYGAGKTDAELRIQATFTNWNFITTWRFEAGQMPRLQWEP